MPACAKSGAASTTRTSSPACAATWAMPCPICPAPRTPSLFTVVISGPFHQQRDALAAADTERGSARLCAARGHRVQQRHQDARARGPDRVPERDRAAPHVDLVGIEAEQAVVRDRD